RDTIVQLTYPQLEAGDYQIVIKSANVRDRAGNAIGATDTVITFKVAGQFSAKWINPAGGFWDVAANWDTGVVPGADDDVLIDVPGNVTITYRATSGNTTIA